MRPARRLLSLAAAALVLTLIAVAAPPIPELAVMALLAALAALALADLAMAVRGNAVSLEPAGAPGEVFTGEVANVPLLVTARGGGNLPAIREARVELDRALGGLVPVPMIAEGRRKARGTLRLEARRRGVFGLHALWLRWESPLGLWEMTPRLPLDLELRVIPNIRPVTSGKIDTLVRSDLYGVKDTALRGEGSEFHQLREFTTGMDSRTIDWKRSARHRGLVAKEMRAERNHQIILALDNGYLMRAEVEGLPRIDHAINAALGIAWAAALGGDLVGLYSFDAEPRGYLPPQPGRSAFPILRAQTARLGYSSVESNHTLALAHLGGLLSRRSLIVIFSDFADTTTAELLVENLAVLHRMHVIVFVSLRDPGLERRQDGAARNPQDVAEAVVAAEMARERQLVLDRLTRIGVICIETGPAELTPRLLATYLDIKARELI